MRSSIAFLIPVLSLFVACSSSKKVAVVKKNEVQIVNNEASKRIDVNIEGKLFTAYQWPDSAFKPVLYPVINAAGTEITRGYPLMPRSGERVDHPHHIGIWLNYGNVNGIDFWGNSYDIPAETRKTKGGTIKYLRSEKIKGGSGSASMTVYNSWQDPEGKELLYEKTDFEFISNDSVRIIDRVTSLTATTGAVTLPDTKEGMFAIRVARQLELPSMEEVVLTDANNIATTVPKMSNEGVTGNYRSSEGIMGDSVWGTRAKWMNLSGNMGNEEVSVAIIDHPKNTSYPTYWHARGYGLFSANPLGGKDFTDGSESVNYSIASGQTVTFRYRVVITSNKQLTDEELNKLSDDFGKKY